MAVWNGSCHCGAVRIGVRESPSAHRISRTANAARIAGAESTRIET